MIKAGKQIDDITDGCIYTHVALTNKKKFLNLKDTEDAQFFLNLANLQRNAYFQSVIEPIRGD